MSMVNYIDFVLYNSQSTAHNISFSNAFSFRSFLDFSFVLTAAIMASTLERKEVIDICRYDVGYRLYKNT